MLVKGFKKLIVVLIIALVVGETQTAVALAATNSASATTVTLSEVKGTDVTIKSGSGKKLKLRDKMKLYSGYSVSTGSESYVYLMLDKTKAIKLDQNTEVSIKKEGKKNEIKLVDGEIFFDVSEKLKSDETLKISTSNCTMGIRGTSGTCMQEIETNANNVQQLHQTFQIYDGVVSLNMIGSGTSGTKILLVEAGNQMSLTYNGSGKDNITKKQVSLNDLPSFAIEEIQNNSKLMERVNDVIPVDEKSLEKAYKAAKQKETVENNELINKQIDLEKYADGLTMVSESKEVVTHKSTNTHANSSVTSPWSSGNTGGSGSSGRYPTQVPTIAPVTPSPTPEAPTPTPEISYLEASGIINDIAIFDVANLNRTLEEYKTVVLQSSLDAEQYQIIGNEAVSIPEGSTLRIPEDMTLVSMVEIRNNGTFEKYGNEPFYNSSVFINAGILNNYGCFVNQEKAVLTNLDSGLIKVATGAALYNNDGCTEKAKGGDITNCGSITIQGEFINGSKKEAVLENVENVEELACMVNYGTITETLTNTEAGYVRNTEEGKMEQLIAGGGALLNDSVNSIGNTIGFQNELLPFIVTLKYVSGAEVHLLTMNEVLSELPWPEEELEFHGWDTDIFSYAAMDRFYSNALIIHEYTGEKKPDTFLSYENGDNAIYNYGCSFKEAFQTISGGESETGCCYHSMLLNRNLKLSDEFLEEDKIEFNICPKNDKREFMIFLNGYQIDFSGRQAQWNSSQKDLTLNIIG